VASALRHAGFAGRSDRVRRPGLRVRALLEEIPCRFMWLAMPRSLMLQERSATRPDSCGLRPRVHPARDKREAYRLL